ncbi:MAG: hypothetical protein KDB32_07230 [Planctomycetes bacterium]|nr:hypothetical protein [Planctomycetota bacterium]
MKKTLLILTTALLLGGCGAGNAPNVPPPDATGNNTACNTDDADPWKSIPEPTASVNQNWLNIVATGEGDDFNLSIDGKKKDADALSAELSTYASQRNESAELRGANAEGISGNPVVFTAGPKVSSQAFYATLELMVKASLYRFVVELEVTGQKTRRIWQQLPLDEGLEILPDSRDGDGLPDPGDYANALNDYKFYLALVQDGQKYDFVSHIDGKAKKTEANIDTQALVNNGWNEALYRETRKQLALGLLTRQGTGKQALDTVEISPMGDISAGGPYALWSALFLAMDAADLANNAPNRGDTPKLFTSFRFTDALGNFK